MEIASFLLPKEEVAFIISSVSMQEAMEQLEHHHYTALPIIDDAGKHRDVIGRRPVVEAKKHAWTKF